MRLKPYLLASVMALSLTAGMNHHHKAYAAGSGTQEAPIVLAQNDDNGGFFSHIFNRRGDTSHAKPLFLNRGSSNSVGRPYDFSRQSTSGSRGYNNTGDVSWEAFKEARRQHRLEVAAVADAANRRIQAQIDRELAVMEASYIKDKNGEVSGQSAHKRMVYDPAKVWTYNPNKRNDSDTLPRIYNSTR